GESAIAAVTPRTTSVDAKRPMPVRRSREWVLLCRPGDASAVCRTPIVVLPGLSFDWNRKSSVVRHSSEPMTYVRRTEVIQLNTTDTIFTGNSGLPQRTGKRDSA